MDIPDLKNVSIKSNYMNKTNNVAFAQLCQKLGPHRESNWHQHPNGFGWVFNRATVEQSVYVGPNAIVMGNAVVRDNASIEDEAIVDGFSKIYGHARVTGSAKVTGRSKVYGNSRVSEGAVVSGHCRVFGNARISGDAYICDGVVMEDAHLTGNAEVRSGTIRGDTMVCGGKWDCSPLHIIGPIDSVTNSEPGHVTIGDECRPFNWWFTQDASNYLKGRGCSLEQVQQYVEIVKMVKKLGL